jgi:hypothetical protein
MRKNGRMKLGSAAITSHAVLSHLRSSISSALICVRNRNVRLFEFAGTPPVSGRRLAEPTAASSAYHSDHSGGSAK